MSIGERREHTDEPPAERILWPFVERGPTFGYCPLCLGDGRVNRIIPFQQPVTCPRCGGMGVVRAVVAPTPEAGKTP